MIDVAQDRCPYDRRKVRHFDIIQKSVLEFLNAKRSRFQPMVIPNPLAGPPSSRRGEALWEREGAGLGSLGAASSESGAASHWSVAADWQQDPGRAWPVLPRDVCLS